MFIAVHPYGVENSSFNEKVLVYDTEDLSLDYVNYEDLMRLKIPVYYGGLYESFSMKSYTHDALIWKLRTGRIRGAVKIKYNGIGDFMPLSLMLDNKVLVNMNRGILNGGTEKLDGLIINDVEVVKGSSACIDYIFRFRGCYIIRMFVSNAFHNNNRSVSAAVDCNGCVVAYWDNKFIDCMNPDFGRKVDMMSRY